MTLIGKDDTNGDDTHGQRMALMGSTCAMRKGSPKG